MLKKALITTIAMIGLLAVAFYAYVELNWDKTWDVPVPTLQASTDLDVIERGEYLVFGPAHCSNCHISSFDEFARSSAGEVVRLKGGILFPLPFASIWTANLTPDEETGIGRYDDGLLFRFLRHGVKSDGTATISLLMPFTEMADEDHVAIVSFLKSRGSIRNEIPQSEWSFLGKVLRVFAPPLQPAVEPEYPTHAPAQAPTIDRGRYLARNVANCYGCHTNFDMMAFEQIGGDYGGGSEFEPVPGPGVDANLWFQSANLTPDPSGVLARFRNKNGWIARFRAGRVFPYSPMPWGPFSRMTDADLEALWVYLNSVEPFANEVAPVFRKQG